MKIIISPSKTKKINNLPIKDSGSLTEKEPFYLEITKEIIEKIKTFSVKEIEKKFKLKNEKAQKLLEFYKVMKGIYMYKLILIFLLLGVLGFSKDKTVIRDKKISEEKRKFLLKLSERTPYKTETENLVDYNYICVFNN